MTPCSPSNLVDATTVAEYLDVERDWVYAHASELAARKLGDGPKARLRFSLQEVDERLSACYRSRESSALKPAPQATPRARRRRPAGTSAPLLPIKGGRGAKPAAPGRVLEVGR
jgi:hypothetical protein